MATTLSTFKPVPTTTPSTEHHSSVTVVTTLERAFSVDSCVTCLMPGGDIQPLWEQLVNTAGHKQQCTKLMLSLNAEIGLGFLVRLKQINGSSTGYKQHSWVKNGELRTECKKVQIRRYLIELSGKR